MLLIGRASHRHQLVHLEVAVLALLTALAGCSGGDSTSPPPNPQAVWSAIADRTWTLPGETESYKCSTMQVTSDQYYTGFRLVAPGAAQAEVLVTVGGAPLTQGPFDCYAGSANRNLIYAASLGTGEIKFPAGFGVHVPAGQYVWLNIHIVNAADTGVADSTRVEARIGTAADVTTPINMAMSGTFLINIPADGQTHTASGQCLTATDTHVLAFLPLMRSRGVHQTVKTVVDTTTHVLFDQDFDYQHDSYTQLDTPLLLNAGDEIQTTCSYVNNGSETETYGESSENESCRNAMYRYPIAGNFLSCATGNGGEFDINRE